MKRNTSEFTSAIRNRAVGVAKAAQVRTSTGAVVPGTSKGPSFNDIAADYYKQTFAPAGQAIANLFSGMGAGAKDVATLAGDAAKATGGQLADVAKATGGAITSNANAVSTPFKLPFQLGDLAGGYVKSLTAPRQTLRLSPAGQADAKAYNAADVLKYLLMAGGAGVGLGGLAALSRQTRPDEDPDVYFDSPLTVGDTLKKLKKRKRPAGLFQKESGLFDVTMHPGEKAAPPKDKATQEIAYGDFTFPLAIAATIPTYLAARRMLLSRQKELDKAQKQRVLDAAQQEFDTARALQYEAVMRRKSAGFTAPFVRAWEDLYGSVSNTLTGRSGQPTSAGFKDYLAGALLATVGAHLVGRQLGANMTSTQSAADIRRKILKERRAQLANSPYSALPLAAIDVPYEADVVDAEKVLPKL